MKIRDEREREGFVVRFGEMEYKRGRVGRR